MDQPHIRKETYLYYLKLSVSYAAIFAFQFCILYPLHRSMDLPLWDEAMYMGHGRNFALGIEKLGALAYSPGYVFLYSIFTRLFGTVESIFFMKYFLTLSATLSIFTLLIKKTRLFSMALLLSFLWARSWYNVEASIMVYHFAALIFILALIFQDQSRLIAILLLFMCILIRLEYLFIFLPYCVHSLVQLMRKKVELKDFISVGREPVTSLLAAILIILSGLILINISDWNAGADRIWFAFNQHYALAQIKAEHMSIDFAIDYKFIINRDFPDADSLSGAFLINPSRFAHFVLNNIMNIFKGLSGFLFPGATRYLSCIIIVISLSGYSLCLAWKKREELLSRLRSIASKLGDLRIISLITPLALIPNLFISTKTQYLLMVMPIVYLWIAIAYKTLRGLRDDSAFIKHIPHLFIYLVLLGFIRNPMPFNGLNIQRPVYEKFVKAKGMWPGGNTRLLGIGSLNYASYLGYELCTPIEPACIMAGVKSKDTGIGAVSLREMILTYKPDAILIDHWLIYSLNFDKSSLSIIKSKNWTKYVIDDDIIYFIGKGSV